MEIRFCDICNESVAQIHFDEGRAILRPDGVSCTVSSGGPDSARGTPAGRRAAGGGLWAAALAILVAAGLGWLALDRVERAERALLRESTVRSASLQAGLEGLFLDLDLRAAADAERREALLSELVALRSANQAGRIRVEELAATTQRLLGDVDERLAAVVGSLDSGVRGGELADLARSVENLRGDVEVLAGALVAGLESRPAADGPRTPTAADDDPWLARLRDPDPLVRWNAIDQVVREGDPQRAEVLLPLLADPDLLVRMSVARALGTLGNPLAIPGLIEALEDPEGPVREAAVVALRTLSGRSFRFDPLGDPDDRARRVESWREWWERGGSAEVGG